MTSYGLDEWIWVMFKPTPTWPNFNFGQLFMWLGGSFKKKSEVGATNLIKVLYISFNLGEKCFFFAIQNLDIQSNKFWWYNFMFERTQSHLVIYLFIAYIYIMYISSAYAFIGSVQYHKSVHNITCCFSVCIMYKNICFICVSIILNLWLLSDILVMLYIV